MKRYSLLIILFFIITNCLFSQALEELEKKIAAENGIRQAERYDFKYIEGKVSQQGSKTATTTYNKRGDILEKSFLNEKGVVTGSEKYEYDARGNRTLYERSGNSKYKKQTQYNEQDNILLEAGYNGSENFRNTYSYNSNGRLKEIVYEVSGKVQQKLVYEYQGSSAYVEIFTGGTALSSKIKMVYDSHGNLAEETTLSLDGRELEKKEYKYSPDSKLLEEMKTQNGEMHYRITYVYTGAGDLKEVSEETRAKEKYTKKVYVYDSQGNLTQFKWRRNPDEEFNIKTYTYDSKGVCLTEHTLYPKTKFELLTKFEYQYF